jgi:two-component system, NarL family, sensor histidine kinase UhpB
MASTTTHHWTLRSLLIAASALPALLMLAVVVPLHVDGAERLRQGLEQRASLIAAALAEASEYGLISGNAAALDRSVRGLLKHDSEIASIEIFDSARRPVVALPGKVKPSPELPSVELPVRSSVPDIDFFDSPSAHVSLPEEVQPNFSLGPIAGYVRVTMSTAPALVAQRQRLAIELGAIAAAALVGIALAAGLARRLGASLQGALSALRAMREGRYDLPDGLVIGAELKHLHGAVHSLAESLAAPATTRPPAAGSGTGSGGGLGIGGGNWRPRREATHERNARRLVGRLDAGLLGLRLSARYAAQLAEQAPSEAERRQAEDAALRILSIADQARGAGALLLDPMRERIVVDLGLEAALQELCRACSLACPGGDFQLDYEGSRHTLTTIQAAALHRAAHEALAQVVACADTSQGSVLLQVQADSGRLRVVVGDNEAAAAALLSVPRLDRIRDSVASHGGRVDVERTAAQGATLVFTLPVAPLV